MAMTIPAYFVELDGYKLSNLIIPLIQLIYVGMGTSRVFGILSEWSKTPKGVLIRAFSQVLIMPIIGFFVASVSGFQQRLPQEINFSRMLSKRLASNGDELFGKANLALFPLSLSCCFYRF